MLKPYKTSLIVSQMMLSHCQTKKTDELERIQIEKETLVEKVRSVEAQVTKNQIGTRE